MKSAGHWMTRINRSFRDRRKPMGRFWGWEHQLVLDEARRRFALGARLGAPYIVATRLAKTSHGWKIQRTIGNRTGGRD